MKNPELVLVIPVFNEEKVIKQVINKWLKALKQINFKIIIINDGSNDKSKRIIKSILTNKIILLNKKKFRSWAHNYIWLQGSAEIKT